MSEQRSNSVSGEQLRSYVERVERIREEKSDLSDDEKAVLAEAQAAGFDTKILKHVVKIREQKPSDLQEAQALTDLYLDALGMSRDLPLFRTVDLMSVDIAAKEQVIEALKKLVPAVGSITIEAGGAPIRMTRDKAGNVSTTEVKKAPKAPAEQEAPRRQTLEVPDTDADGAEALGRQAAKDDLPVIKNPFPFGDVRRARFDLGWRKQTGNDGMGPG